YNHPTYYFDAADRFVQYMKVKPQDKRLLQNLPYAKRGYVFMDKTLQRHFNNLWWYIPDPNYVPQQSDFSDKEWQQIKK
ncbi:MAG: YARHG domain-containing protein, partial [Bacteroidaceae bacterium]|nr:YARHG domain-containing protein [Bacteroidaceae bacterium]